MIGCCYEMNYATALLSPKHCIRALQWERNALPNVFYYFPWSFRSVIFPLISRKKTANLHKYARFSHKYNWNAITRTCEKWFFFRLSWRTNNLTANCSTPFVHGTKIFPTSYCFVFLRLTITSPTFNKTNCSICKFWTVREFFYLVKISNY